MNLDHITTIEDFKQRIPALISCGGVDSEDELCEIFKRFNHGRKMKKRRSGKRTDQLGKAIIKSVERLKRYKQPLTLENVANGLNYCLYDDDGQLIIESIEYDQERMEKCIYWWRSNGNDAITPVSRIRDRLKRLGGNLIN